MQITKIYHNNHSIPGETYSPYIQVQYTETSSRPCTLSFSTDGLILICWFLHSERMDPHVIIDVYKKEELEKQFSQGSSASRRERKWIGCGASLIYKLCTSELALNMFGILDSCLGNGSLHYLSWNIFSRGRLLTTPYNRKQPSSGSQSLVLDP